MLKYTKQSVIAFDFKEALSFEGETGPYCQYAAVRANSIFRKLEVSTRSGIDGAENEALSEPQKGVSDHGPSIKSFSAGKEDVNQVLQSEAGDEIWTLLMLAARLEESNLQAAGSAEPAVLAKYTFNLAKAFNLFYHRHRIIAE